MKNKLSYIIALIVTAFTATSCVDDLNVIPINPQVTQTFNQDEVFAKVYASYALTGQEGPAGNSDIEGLDEGRFSIYRCLWNVNELSTDEAICSWSDAEVLELNYNNWSSQSTITDGLYSRLYFTVTLCNHFLEQTSGKTDDSSVKQRAEVRFLRAMAYYYLMDFFGNVPFTDVVSLTPP
ncbi:MAG: RagB/SusD family nutrient uptake outer membrane protein, partial [Paludibacter sp.]|nr:RagB/SusD family nutrient uptake outer membrane protein [Paludibacter sp.]